ncbi:uncharacterized protein LOC119338179 [Triticum dicoccoides]|uniref:uncharacterized protein LOC119338179 n=1 Tax=Triticum dicoccoides TaxID=85692 RepID=UPI001891D60A|nr:uncharacterized protein LOC119338179 [Triticum dicoccoides]
MSGAMAGAGSRRATAGGGRATRTAAGAATATTPSAPCATAASSRASSSTPTPRATPSGSPAPVTRSATTTTMASGRMRAGQQGGDPGHTEGLPNQTGAAARTTPQPIQEWNNLELDRFNSSCADLPPPAPGFHQAGALLLCTMTGVTAAMYGSDHKLIDERLPLLSLVLFSKMEVEDLARRLNSVWPERMHLGQERRIESQLIGDGTMWWLSFFVAGTWMSYVM